MPDAVVIDDIFPYSVNNLALTGQPYFSRIWRWALARKRYGPALAGYLINIRNLFQVGIAIDHRYAPLYGQAMAEVFLDSLLRYQYDPESKVPDLYHRLQRLGPDGDRLQSLTCANGSRARSTWCH